MTEKIVLPARRKRQLKSLAALLGDAGFNRVEYEKDKLIVERLSEDLRGNVNADYSIVFGKKSIEFSYALGKSSATQKRLEMLPLFFHVLVLAKSHYEVDATTLFEMVLDLFEKLRGTINRETVDVAAELNETKEKHANLLKKYEEVVRASEENSRLLLEAEQRYHELSVRLQQLEGMSNEVLKEELYKWIKIHNGAIDISEFAKAHGIQHARVEEGLEMLMHGAYIKKKT